MGVRIVLANFLSPNLEPVYRAVAAFLQRRLGGRVDLVEASDYGSIVRGEVDVAFLCGPPFLHLAGRGHLQALAAPVLSGERYGGRPVYYSDVVVSRDHPARTLEDLSGCVWAYNGQDSHSGYTAVLDRLLEMGETPSFFGRLVRSGSHLRSLQLVVDGEVEASAVDSQVLAVAMRDRPELAQRLRVVDAIGPSAIQPVAAAAHLPEALRARIARSLTEMHLCADARAGLSAGFVERFVPVGVEDYTDIARAVQRVRSAGLLPETWPSPEGADFAAVPDRPPCSRTQEPVPDAGPIFP